MAQRTLTFLENTPKKVVFIDPTNIDNRLTQNLQMSRKQLSRDLRVKTVRLDVNQQRTYSYTAADSKVYPDSVGARVILTGASPAEIQLVWKDLKANVDAMIAANALIGVPAAISSSTYVVDKT